MNRNNILPWLIYCIAVLSCAQGHGQQPIIWHIPVTPVLPPAPLQPVAPVQPWAQPQQAFRIHYPTPLRSLLFGSHLVPVQRQPPPTMIRTPYLWGPLE